MVTCARRTPIAGRWLRPGACSAQIAKLLIIPFVCLVERFYLGRVFSREVVASILLVILGVAIV